MLHIDKTMILKKFFNPVKDKAVVGVEDLQDNKGNVKYILIP